MIFLVNLELPFLTTIDISTYPTRQFLTRILCLVCTHVKKITYTNVVQAKNRNFALLEINSYLEEIK